MKLDFRDAVFSAVQEVMSADNDAVILYNDMGAMGLDTIRESFPSRVVNAGIAEQNMASVAAGLALTGKRVFMYGIIAHIFSRGFEQIRNDICCTNLPVIMLGVGSGLSYGSDGPTHHGVQDIAVMRTLPNLAIYNPADGVAAGALVRAAAERGGPAYLRMDKEQLPAIYHPEGDFRSGLAVLHEGNEIALCCTGVLVHRALEAARLLAQEGVMVRVVDLFRLKPLQVGAICEALSGVKGVVTLEENSPVGGLATVVAEVVGRHQLGISFTSIGIEDAPLMGACSRSWAERKYGLTLEQIVATVRKAARERA